MGGQKANGCGCPSPWTCHSAKKKFLRNWQRCTKLHLMSLLVSGSAHTLVVERPLDSPWCMITWIFSRNSSPSTDLLLRVCTKKEGISQTAKGEKEQNEEGPRNQES